MAGLNLTRYPHQRVVLQMADGEEVVLTVNWVNRGGKVSLNFQGPDSVNIVREELLDGRCVYDGR